MNSQRPVDAKKKKSRPGNERARAGLSETKSQKAAESAQQDLGEPAYGVGSAALLALAFVAGFVLRSIYLEIKPPHFDEGINGNFVAKMWQEGFYRYDPTNFHGPLYFYFLQFAELVFGRGIFGFRFVTGLISLASVILVAKHRKFVGRAAVWAAFVLAFSTGCVFYSRYAIHESLFIFTQVLFSYGWFDWQAGRSRRAIVMMVAGFFGMFAIKETYFVFFVIWFIAVLCERVWSRLKGEAPAPAPEPETGRGFWGRRATPRFMIASAFLGFMAVIVLYSGFFIRPSGIVDMFASVAFWVKTGTGNSGHEKPFTYWLALLSRYELPGLIGLLASVPVFFFAKNPRIRILSIFSFGNWLAYSIIPYKTPWLILNLLWSLAIVYGELGNFLRRLKFVRPGVLRTFILIAPVAWSSIMMERLNFHEFTNEREPYVYVQSTMTMKHTLDYVAERVRRFPEDLNMKVKVLVRDPWPLPWIFGRYPNLVYGRADIQELAGSDVLLIDGADKATIESRLPGRYWRVPFQIRDSYDKGFAFLAYEKFKGIVPSDAEIFEGAGGPQP